MADEDQTAADEKKRAKLQARIRELEEELDGVDNQPGVRARLAKLQKDYDTLSATYEETAKKLSGFEGEAAWGTTLDELLEAKEFKGKINVDRTAAIKYLKRGGYDPKTIEQDVKDAIGVVGQKVSPRSTAMNNGGTGGTQDADTTDSQRKETAKRDPIGAMLLNQVAGGSAVTGTA